MRFRAYLFDVQGTLLDFFTPVSTAVQEYLSARGITHVRAADFTRDWRSEYFQKVNNVPTSVDSWPRVQNLYLAAFGEMCSRYGLDEPDPDDAEAISESWQRLEPWPDVRSGMAQLRQRAITATLSNADMSTVISLFKSLAIEVDAIFTAELFGAFKPDPVVYQRALRYLSVPAGQAAMVASHPYDLEAARSLGLGTIFLSRPDEYGDPALAASMTSDTVTQIVHSVEEIE